MRAFNSSPAKEPPLFQSTQTQPAIIDLTNDSDSDDYGRPRIISKPRTLLRDATLSRNHGLKLQGPSLLSHMKIEDIESGINGQTPSNAAHPAFVSTSFRAGSRRRTIGLPDGGGQTGGISSQGHEETSPSMPSPAKRRKIDGRAGVIHRSVKPVSVFKHGTPIQAPTAKVSSADRYQNDPRMHSVINDPVLKHVTNAISRYRNIISKEDRDRIAKKVVIKIVSREDFVLNFEANGFSLSTNYKKEVAERAEKYIHKSAKVILARSRNILTPQNNSISAHAASTATAAFRTSIPSRPSPTKENASSARAFSPSSRSSSEDKGALGAGNLEGRRHYSSSPTTSFTDVYEDTEDKPKVQQSHSQLKNRIIRVPIQSPPSKQHSQAAMIHQKRAKDDEKLPMHSYSDLPLDSNSTDSHHLRQEYWKFGPNRPYLCFADREYVKRGLGTTKIGRSKEMIDCVFHVDFSLAELESVDKIIKSIIDDIQQHEPITSAGQLTSLLRDNRLQIDQVYKNLKVAARANGSDGEQQALTHRDNESIYAFVQDAFAGRLHRQPQVLRIGSRQKHRLPAVPHLSTLLRERETWGMIPQRLYRGLQSFEVEIYSYLEDTLTRKCEWMDCSGDISAISWTSDDTFICGATAHSDYHNMQYNKPGNLGVGSCSLATLRSVPDHRIPRPVIGSAENNENSLEAMRQTQDRWLYTSVVSTSYSEFSGFTFTASFDQTVKVWKGSDQGASMNLIGTWEHDGKVNFVVTSMWHGKVATASDVSNNAVRLYDIDQADVSESGFKTFSGDRAKEQAMELERNDTWAYFPATIAWGIAPSVQNILLVGYSPRSISGHEMDIPEDKRNSGELCLWDTEGERLRITSAHLQNVFEVIWHQTQPIFLAATSPCGTYEPAVTKTQVRLFAQNEFGVFLQVKTLDCGASDINELTVMPNGNIQCYVTASCTDGNTYVWDTAQGDRPIHTLGHGDSLDNPLHDVPREVADTGVKFASWGRTSSRFYTGSSDGKVKAWDIRAPKGQAFVRTVLSVSGGVASGVFSKDFSKLLVGDATGKVHLLGIDGDDLDDDTPQERASTATSVKTASWLPKISGRRVPPRIILPHQEPTPTLEEREESTGETAEEMGRAYLEEGQLRICPDRRIGTVQGPNYAETKLYRIDAHEDNDSTKPLLPSIQSRQQYEVVRTWEHTLRVARLPRVSSSSQRRHARNVKLDLELSTSEQQELERDGIDLTFEPNNDFEYEVSLRTKKFKVGT